MSKANCLVLSGYGLNCEQESKTGFEKAGGIAEIIHVNELIEKPAALDNYNMLLIPGGFSFGDDLGSGKVLANKLKFRLKDKLWEFIQNKKLVLGICNGFQVLAKLGLLPIPDFEQRITVTRNDSGKFEDRWVYLKINKSSPCIFTKDLDYIMLPVRHGEGKFMPKNENELKYIIDKNLFVAQYANEKGVTSDYPYNPNGSVANIAGICDESGRIFGLMPHPEAFVDVVTNPYWTRVNITQAQGLLIFKNAVNYLETKF